MQIITDLSLNSQSSKEFLRKLCIKKLPAPIEKGYFIISVPIWFSSGTFDPTCNILDKINDIQTNHESAITYFLVEYS